VTRLPARGFTLLELLVAMALFAILGVAVVALLGQGLAIFSEGTADTTMQDRLQSALPQLRSDFAAIMPVEPPEVLPPPMSEEARQQATAGSAAPAVEAPAVRLRSGWLRLRDVPTDWPPVFFVAFVRANAQESEDPLLRDAGTAALAAGSPMRVYDPAAVDGGERGNLVAPGGVLEVAWIAVPEDPFPDRRTGPPTPDPTWPRGVLTLYRLFRAPVGGAKTLLDPANLDSLAKIRAAGRPMHDGVLHFGVTFRNVFAKSFTDGVGGGRAGDGEPYVGSVWDSTRALDKQFALHRGAESLADPHDDVFPAAARIEVALAIEGPFGFGRGETLLAAGIAPEEKRLTVESVDPLFVAGPAERAFKVEGEWMSTLLDTIDMAERRVTVQRGQRGTPPTDHAAGAPVYVGRTVSTDVPLVYKDRYARAR
jgi:prepilin-type N-terminal cleavage/methylation domain-containing protein